MTLRAILLYITSLYGLLYSIISIYIVIISFIDFDVGNRPILTGYHY